MKAAKLSSCSRAGFSFIELVTVLGILLALSYFALPSMELSFVKSREKMLHERLREIRGAIDRYVAARNSVGASRYPPSVASLSEKIPNALLLPGANPGPFLAVESFANPFTDGGQSYWWDIREVDGTWHLDQKSSKNQIDVFDVRYPANGLQGWTKALDGTNYAEW